MGDSNEYKYLTKIDYPIDLRKLKVEELPTVCEELRRDIIEELATNPGHRSWQRIRGIWLPALVQWS